MKSGADKIMVIVRREDAFKILWRLSREMPYVEPTDPQKTLKLMAVQALQNAAVHADRRNMPSNLTRSNVMEFLT